MKAKFKCEARKWKIKQQGMNDSFDRYSSCNITDHSTACSLCKDHILSKVKDLHKTLKVQKKFLLINVFMNVTTLNSNIINLVSEDTQQIIFRTQLFANHYALLHEQRDTPNFTFKQLF